MFRLSEFQSVVNLVTNQSVSQMRVQIEIVISTGRDTYVPAMQIDIVACALWTLQTITEETTPNRR